MPTNDIIETMWYKFQFLIGRLQTGAPDAEDDDVISGFNSL